MSKGTSFFHSKVFKVTMSRIYGWGAAVVILGAMFKILHLPGANLWIGIGLSTEAFIFFISAFEPVKEDVDWTLVYPELAGMDPKKQQEKKSMTKELDKMLEEARIEQNMINRLGDSLRGLTDNVTKMTNVSEAALATEEYATKVKSVGQSMDRINQSYVNAIDAIDKLGQTGEVSASYYQQVSAVTDKLSSLNSIYEQELAESNTHLKQLNTFYSTLSRAVENLADSEADTKQLRTEFTKLNSNLSTLNNIYGNMLSAMSAARA